MTRPEPLDPAGTPSLTDLTAAVEHAYDLIATLRKQIDTVVAELAPPARRAVRVVRWAELDADAAAQAWQQLGDWVSWLTDRYALREIPVGCWWRHGMLVEELTALWLAWQTSHAPAADATAPLIWHEHLDRFRDRVRLRLQQQGNCVSAGHQDRTPPTYAGAVEQFRRHVTADVAARLTAARHSHPVEPASAGQGGETGGPVDRSRNARLS